ncbi:MFS transporter [Flavobacterium akiainvivens]|uniref:MFS transporter n=1 Tax=Flavobacterium akiainvivens TaxID=1202724 RepID=A0A0M8MBY9_9FLAO|nr:MFS transporter [Flavobacterium akiainvivens]KOS06945.1 MFS transporter [Flavobacterium akiainvivens]SFQ60212.1 Predicted arabinose efflux permease, MFS family [Flavobacterium akiainvivens]
MEKQKSTALTSYQWFVVIILALTQFTVILDFMVMSPMGDILMKSLNMSTQQFGIAVSAYAFSAGASGLLTAGFADKFDRKKLLLFFYIGFTIGTVFCGLAESYTQMVAARIFTGLFGGVIGSISMAIVTDIFTLQQRGRVMGVIQMGFGVSQVMGIPVGLWVANHFGWHTTFIVVAALAALIAILIVAVLKPVNAHLAIKHDRSPLTHLLNTLKNRDYRIAFSSTALLSIGGFMMMPFGSTFAVNNLGVSDVDLPLVFMYAGIATLIAMPFMGFLSDRVNKFRLFAVACLWATGVILVYTHMGNIAFGLVVTFNILMMVGITGRMVPSTTLVSGVPAMQDRGAFMSINASLQQISGGIGAVIGGLIVVQPTKASPLEHYEIVGYIVAVITFVSIGLMYRVDRLVKRKATQQPLNNIQDKDIAVVEA